MTFRLGLGAIFQVSRRSLCNNCSCPSFSVAWVFCSALAQDDFMGKTLTPTAIAIGGSVHAYAALIITYMMQNNWSHVSMVEQTDSFTPYYSIIRGSFLSQVKDLTYTYAIIADVFFFKRSNRPSMIEALEAAKQKSRGTVSRLDFPPKFPFIWSWSSNEYETEVWKTDTLPKAMRGTLSFFQISVLCPLKLQSKGNSEYLLRILWITDLVNPMQKPRLSHVSY